MKTSGVVLCYRDKSPTHPLSGVFYWYTSISGQQGPTLVFFVILFSQSDPQSTNNIR